jgi:hypothetical protein
MFVNLIKKMADASKINQASEIQIYNKDVQSSPFIKIAIPAAAVTAATLAGSLTYAATNASVSVISTATEIGINGVGFIAGKAAGALLSPVIGTSISVGSGFAAAAAKETIQTKGKFLSIATGSVAGAGAAIAVTAGSYIFNGLQSLGESVANKLHTWARASEYKDMSSDEQQPIWGMTRENAIKTPTEEIEILDEQLIIASPTFHSEETTKFMKQVEEVAMSLPSE